MGQQTALAKKGLLYKSLRQNGMCHVELHSLLTFYDACTIPHFWGKTGSGDRESEARILYTSSNVLMKKNNYKLKKYKQASTLTRNGNCLSVIIFPTYFSACSWSLDMSDLLFSESFRT